jgi:hypothetical protein
MAAGVLAAHALAYRITGTPAGSVHGYLDHAPQVLLVLAALGLVFAGFTARLRVLAAWPFPVAALAAFVAQEHVEQLGHTGRLPWLLLTPAFLVGVLLQVPVALLTWWVARRLLAILGESRALQPALSRVLLAPAARPGVAARPAVVVAPRGRGPPLLRDP